MRAVSLLGALSACVLAFAGCGAAERHERIRQPTFLIRGTAKNGHALRVYVVYPGCNRDPRRIVSTVSESSVAVALRFVVRPLPSDRGRTCTALWDNVVTVGLSHPLDGRLIRGSDYIGQSFGVRAVGDQRLLVPDVRGLAIDQASDALCGAGMHGAFDRRTAGRFVVTQSPAGGTRVAADPQQDELGYAAECPQGGAAIRLTTARR